MPLGTLIHNIELTHGRGGQLVRSAGTSAQILGRDKGFVIIRLSSGEVRRFKSDCRATVGTVGNAELALVNYGKAGRVRHQGVRPTVRGSVMNPVDHAHGGGEGRQPIGHPAPAKAQSLTERLPLAEAELEALVERWAELEERSQTRTL